MTSTPARIAFIITELDEGGAERALTQIVTRLDRSRWEPQVFSLAGPGPLAQQFKAAGIPVFDCGARTADCVFSLGQRRGASASEAVHQFTGLLEQLVLYSNKRFRDFIIN